MTFQRILCWMWLLYLLRNSFFGIGVLVFQSVLFPRNRVVYGSVDVHDHVSDLLHQLDLLRDTLNNHNNTFGLPYTGLLDRRGFDTLHERLTRELKRTFPHVSPIHAMNEVYVSADCGDSRHIDGLFGVYPFCSVYRVVLSLTPNERISTVIPNANFQTTLTTGRFVGFDLHRDIHFVECDRTRLRLEPRVLLKFHYLVYPNKWFFFLAYPLQWMTLKTKHIQNIPMFI